MGRNLREMGRTALRNSLQPSYTQMFGCRDIQRRENFVMETSMFKLRQIAALAIVAGCVAASGASAKAVWPKSIVGTWNGTSNQTSIVLTVSTQTAGGDCQSISG